MSLPVEARRPIPVRQMKFDFTDANKGYWMDNDPFLTHMLNALSLTFPEGERFFMDAVRHFYKEIQSTELRHDISRFLGQEAMHGLAHESFNEYVKAQGYDTDGVEKHLKSRLAFVRKHRSAKGQLAVTCALEHFTAILAELMLEHEDVRELFDKDMLKMWMWHAIEETEHKAVAFDTYQAAGGTYAMRALTMMQTTVLFCLHVTLHQIRLWRSDPNKNFSVRAFLRGHYRLWVAPGYFRRLLPAYLNYYRPNFHPWQRNSNEAFDRALANLTLGLTT